jgi:hypothetical protein
MRKGTKPIRARLRRKGWRQRSKGFVQSRRRQRRKGSKQMRRRKGRRRKG